MCFGQLSPASQSPLKNLIADPMTMGLLSPPKIPKPPPVPSPPQLPKAPSTLPLQKRNASSGMAGYGQTQLTGASGVPLAQLNLGGVSLLGGG